MASSKISPLTSDIHISNLSEGLKDLWNEKLLCDYTLMAECESISVHKVVMAACSPYFRAMFCGQMQESKESQVKLKGITAGALRSLVNFAYSGELELSMEYIEEVVAAVSYFQMSEAEVLCIDFMNSKLDKENCVDILNLADKYSLQRLQENTIDFIKKQFQNLPEDEFMKLSWKHLPDITGSNSLCINSEYQLFKRLMLWIREHSDVTEESIYDILSKVRFPLMYKEELLRASQTEVMMSSPKCQALISEARRYHKDVLKQPLRQSEKTQVRNDTRSYILAANNAVYFVNQEQSLVDNNSKLKKIYLDSPLGANLRLEQMVVVDNYLYACHSWSERKYFYRYDPRFDEWLKLPNLTMRRDYLRLVRCKESVFAIGMHDEMDVSEGRQEEKEANEDEEEDTDDGEEEDEDDPDNELVEVDRSEAFVEIFSIEDNKWHKCASVNLIGPHFADVAFQQKVYVSGGQVSSTASSDVSCFTIATNSWESKSPMIHKRSFHEMAELNGVIYVFGGNGESSVEYYLPDTDQWTDCRISFPFRVFGVVVDEDIYIFSRNDSVYDVKIYFRKFDPETETTSEALSRRLEFNPFYDLSCAGFPLTLLRVLK